MSTQVGKKSMQFALLPAPAPAVASAETRNVSDLCPSGQMASGPCPGAYGTVGNAQPLSSPRSLDGIAYLPGGSMTSVDYRAAENAGDEITIEAASGQN